VLRSPVVVDGRNLYSPQKMRELGFVYRSIGRNDALAPNAAHDASAAPSVGANGASKQTAGAKARSVTA